MKKVYKRFLFIGLSLSLLALTGLKALAESEIEGDLDEGQSPPEPPQDIGAYRTAIQPRFIPQPLSATTVTFSGTLLRDGNGYILRETAGVLYPLDGPAQPGRASRFEGDSVRVTGKLDTSTHLLHVDDIEAFVA